MVYSIEIIKDGEFVYGCTLGDYEAARSTFAHVSSTKRLNGGDFSDCDKVVLFESDGDGENCIDKAYL